MALLQSKPKFSGEQATDIAESIYEIDVREVRALDSERDQNFLIETDRGDFVLRISATDESRTFIEAQNQMLEHLANGEIVCPVIQSTKEGQLVATVPSTDSDGEHLVRLVSYLAGCPLAELNYHSPELCFDLGQQIGRIDHRLESFDHLGLHREFHWDLARAVDEIKSRLGKVDADTRDSILYFADQFERNTAPYLDQLPKSAIHNDANDYNVLAQPPNHGQPAQEVTGVIDFGDAVHSWTVADLAVAIAYLILDKPDPVSVACQVVKGYCSERTLSDSELDALFGLICMRLCLSVAIAADQTKESPDDPYLNVSQQPIRNTLPQLQSIPYQFATTAFREAAGRIPVRKYDAVCSWLQNEKEQFCFPIQPRPVDSEMMEVDLGVTQPLVNFSASGVQISERAVDEPQLAVGRYLEPRLVYSADHYSGSSALEERRTIHLGVDLFAESGTPVHAPIDGVVKYVRTSRRELDYGTFVVLEHDAGGELFWTLYGHLSQKTQNHVEDYQQVKKGDVIGWLGDRKENGGWIPHLHFQIMLDLLEHENFPGVGHASKTSIWSRLCPDPNLILGLDESSKLKTVPTRKETLENRHEFFSGNLSLSYDQPLKMVRGWKQYLFDETGRQYLDAYNNVPHVGHCHPAIESALVQQLRLLNTNTRYLNDVANEFAKRLAATMPDGLDVCFFLNSASEANELALRLARAKTGGNDLIVLEDAYHGHTSTLIDISPYKHEGPGGNGPPDWVHVTPNPDIFRGKHRDPETAGMAYAEDVSAAIENIDRCGGKLSGFIAESCPSVAGQIILPANYLRSVYKKIREAGGVCIADDVQTGYGRLGQAFYGFELQDVVPDMVVLGKPIGNGHPLAAVVTTREIADSFNNGMEFFSTFGGNNVSCAVGLEVLKTVQQEELQNNARVIGEYLITRLGELQQLHSIVGDVRGSGFFLGVELIRDHSTLEPATEEARFVCNRMKCRGVLIGTDGRFNNVLKIRPPMCFNMKDARFLIECLNESIQELS